MQDVYLACGMPKQVRHDGIGVSIPWIDDISQKVTHVMLNLFQHHTGQAADEQDVYLACGIPKQVRHDDIGVSIPWIDDKSQKVTHVMLNLFQHHTRQTADEQDVYLACGMPKQVRHDDIGISIPRMILNNRAFQILPVQVRVNLCCGNAFMAQHFLYGAQVGAALYQVGGK